MTDISRLTVIFGIAGTVLVLFVTIARQRRLDPSDFYSFVAAFFSSSNLPPAAYFVWYGFNPDAAFTQTNLQGQERYISMAGVVLFLVSAISMWKLLQTAWTASLKTRPTLHPLTLSHHVSNDMKNRRCFGLSSSETKHIIWSLRELLGLAFLPFIRKIEGPLDSSCASPEAR